MDDQVTLFEPRSQDKCPRVHGDICPTLNTMRGATATVHIERKRNDKKSSYQKTNPVGV